MCGTTGAQKSILTADQNLGQELRNAYATDFGESQQLFQELHSSLDSIVAAGPSQEGMSPTELAAENSQAINSAAAANKQVEQAIGENAAKSGAAPGVETGIEQAEKAGAATQVESNLANKEADITQQDYAIGRQNFDKAVGEEEGLAGATFNPATSAGGAAVGAEEAAGTQANANQQASDSWMGLVGGLAGSAAGMFKFGK